MLIGYVLYTINCMHNVTLYRNFSAEFRNILNTKRCGGFVFISVSVYLIECQMIEDLFMKINYFDIPLRVCCFGKLFGVLGYGTEDFIYLN